ncbi:DNA alkylation repair protein [Listeria newyorkensis]|uniref:DNA alkylation repair protein n=1 Tax=Listeria newyorkensis TaxID=1497681 RepID=A0A841Z0E7_9LIST|nr:DNA alkylation repair protein [Listeria newyorkensis]MBC1459140.1 DNA alkylation repair protein [Listeria newyorkensis]
MNTNEVMQQLESLGSEQTKKTLCRHGVNEPVFGVKIGDMKKLLVKKIKDSNVSRELFATGNYDAQYLAGLTINPKEVTKEDLLTWAETANCSAINEAIVASLAAETPYATKLAKKWMSSDEERIEDTGWSCYANYLSLAPNEEINETEVLTLLENIEKNIHEAKNSVKYTMNQFVICTGSYYPPLLEKAISVAENIGQVHVDMGDTSCKVPLASDYIEKVIEKDRVGKKRKRAIC